MEWKRAQTGKETQVKETASKEGQTENTDRSLLFAPMLYTLKTRLRNLSTPSRLSFVSLVPKEV